MTEQITPTLKPIYAKPVSTTFTFYLYQVGAPEDYVDWYETIRNAGSHDTIYIHINSPGGRMSTAQQLLRAISECQGTVICSVEGECASAATMIFLAADGFEVSPHSIFMFHNYSGGAFGKGGEMFDRIGFEKDWAEKLMRESYKDFLTEDEMREIFLGRDKYMDSEEVMERLGQRQKIREEQQYQMDLEITPLETLKEELTNIKRDIKLKQHMIKSKNDA